MKENSVEPTLAHTIPDLYWSAATAKSRLGQEGTMREANLDASGTPTVTRSLAAFCLKSSSHRLRCSLPDRGFRKGGGFLGPSTHLDGIKPSRYIGFG